MIMHSLSLPSTWIVTNLVKVWGFIHFNLYLMNTLIYSVGAIVIVLLVASMAAYAVSKVLPSLTLYTILTIGLTVPFQALMLPEYIIIIRLHLLNTYPSLMLVYAAMLFSVDFFIMFGFMKQVPREMEEAAAIEGAGRARIFASILMPVCVPAIATVFILDFVDCWNAYLMPLVLISDTEKFVLSQGVNFAKTQNFVDYSLLSAAIFIAVFPIIIIYIAFQEYLVKGFMAGALKG
jgi:ABC-type glycerol-3-phosphate transport system permease component